MSARPSSGLSSGPSSGTWRVLLTPRATLRLIVGWGTVVVVFLASPVFGTGLPGPVLTLLLTALIGVIVFCAFGVVHEAEHLARRLGDPYGSLVLTLSIVVIEVVLISAVMLGPGQAPTIARDSVMAVSMIILNLVIGLSLLLGGIRYGGMAPNRAGASAYLVMLIVLIALGLVLPAVVGADGAYTPAQQIPVVLITLGLYGFFLFRQTGAQATDFHETMPTPASAAEAAAGTGAGSSTHDDGAGTFGAATRRSTGVREVIRVHRTEVGGRTGLLVATVLPIVLLSHDMATLLDDGLGRLSAPVALAGVLIAMIVFLPEGITSVRAVLQGEIQRVSNLCHGALVSTVGLTIPAVLVIGKLTGQQVVLAETPAHLLLLAITLALTGVGAVSGRVTAVHGAAHLAVFALYGITLFS